MNDHLCGSEPLALRVEDIEQATLDPVERHALDVATLISLFPEQDHADDRLGRLFDALFAETQAFGWLATDLATAVTLR